MYFSPYIWATRCVVLLLVLRLRRCALRGILEWDMECEYAEAIMIGFRRKIGSNKHDYYSLKQQSSLFCVSEVSLSSVPSFVPSSRVFFRFFFSVFVSLHSLASLSLLSNDLYFFFSSFRCSSYIFMGAIILNSKSDDGRTVCCFVWRSSLRLF